MNLNDLSKPLPIDSVEFRIQSINKGGYATILAYKDARVDMDVLDTVVGPNFWQRTHSRDNKNCTVSIWCSEISQWVHKEDTGSESNTEKEKGLASDSFKRACTNWGIGRELYAYPSIQIKLNPNEFTKQGDRCKQSYELKLKEWVWYSEFNDGKISYLGAKDTKGNIRFSWGKMKDAEDTPKVTAPKKKPYPVKNYEKAARSIFEGKGTWKQLEENYTVSAAAKIVINAKIQEFKDMNNPEPDPSTTK
jgi:hypothetical protein